MLGNNYNGDPVAFGRELDALLDELAPMPVVLLGVTRFEAEQDEVNYVLSSAAQTHDDVRARRLDGADGRGHAGRRDVAVRRRAAPHRRRARPRWRR